MEVKNFEEIDVTWLDFNVFNMNYCIKTRQNRLRSIRNYLTQNEHKKPLIKKHGNIELIDKPNLSVYIRCPLHLSYKWQNSSTCVHTVKVAIYAGGKVRAFWGQTIRVGIKYADAWFIYHKQVLIFLPYAFIIYFFLLFSPTHWSVSLNSCKLSHFNVNLLSLFAKRATGFDQWRLVFKFFSFYNNTLNFIII